MASQGVTRKRPAPGTSPPIYQQQVPGNMNDFSDGMGPELSNDQFLEWGQTGQPTSTYSGSSNYNFSANPYPSNNTQASTQLARRPVSQMIPLARQGDGIHTGQWLDQLQATAGDAQPAEGSLGDDDDIEELERRAQIAKREAQSKRKQIPPFVQKLNR